MRFLLRYVRRRVTNQHGFTLLELTAVSAILAVLAGIVAVAVSGQATQRRAAAQVADVAEVQKAVDAFAGQHPQARYPTLNGCLPDLVLDLLTLTCTARQRVGDPSQVDPRNLEFEISEAAVQLDVNGDADTLDRVRVVPIIWAKAFLSEFGNIHRFAGGFIQREPKHAFDLFGGIDPEDSWKDGRYVDPDRLGNIDSDDDGNSPTIVAPEGVGTGDNQIDEALEQYPVWVIGPDGRVLNLLPPLAARAILRQSTPWTDQRRRTGPCRRWGAPPPTGVRSFPTSAYEGSGSAAVRGRGTP